MIYTIVRDNVYFDSIFLMKAGRELKKAPGVRNAVLVMGTEVNKSVLKEVGALTQKARDAGPGSLIISLDVGEAGEAKKAEELFWQLTDSQGSGPKEEAESFRTIEQAAARHPESNLAVISLPGEYAADEAFAALRAGLNVFLFSDNVPIEEEVRLKQYAADHGLLVMGPGCGTAVIGGISLGIMSKIRRGTIGIVGASGSGIQEVCVLIDHMGRGVSEAIGTGGRDLSEQVGGSTMLRGIDYLDHDPGTRVIVLISKPPHPAVGREIYERVKQVSKPVVIFFLGGSREEIEASGAFCAADLEEAAVAAVTLDEGKIPPQRDFVADTVRELKAEALSEAEKKQPGQRYLRGLFCGGTHSEEAALLLNTIVPQLHSNLNFAGAIPLDDPRRSVGNSLVDMGDETFTVGRPHPVIDPSILEERLIQEGTDPETAVLLFDLLLGYGIHEDPVGTVEAALGEIRECQETAGRHISLVCALCGTDSDPQGYEDQKRRLEALGVKVFLCNARAALYAGLIAAGKG